MYKQVATHTFLVSNRLLLYTARARLRVTHITYVLIVYVTHGTRLCLNYASTLHVVRTCTSSLTTLQIYYTP